MKKILSSLILIVFAFLLVTKTSLAQTTSNYTAPNLNSDVPQNQSTWIQSIMLNSMSALACQLAGYDPLNQQGGKCLGYDAKTGKLGYVENSGGLIGFTSNAIGMLYVIPVHTHDYVNYMAINFGLSQPTYAESIGGYGYDGIQPLIKVWSAFRNLIYTALIIVFLIIGVAVMFRVKIDPRTVMTLQNQLPRIVIGIILVTFSFAIAGFLIDLMYVSSYLLVGMFSNILKDINPNYADIGLNIVGTTNPISALNSVTETAGGLGALTGNASNAIGGHLGALFDNVPGRALFGILGSVVGLLVGSIIGNVALLSNNAAGIVAAGTSLALGSFGAVAAPQLAGLIISMIAFLVIAVAIITSLFRLWFQLIIAYISILIDVIFAPFWIIAGLIPGSKINFSSWLRNLAANLAAFPAVLALFLLARIFMEAFRNVNSNTFAPPLVGHPLNVDAQGNSELGAIIALGIILISPNVVKMMKQVFGAPAAGFGPVMGGLMAGVGILQTGGRPIWNRLYSRDPRTGQTHGALAGAITSAGQSFGPNLGRAVRAFPGGGRIAGIPGRVRGFRGRLTRGGGPAGRGGGGAEEPEHVRAADDAPLPPEPREEA